MTETVFNPAIPGYASGSSPLVACTLSRKFLVLLTVILSLSCCSLTYSALVGAERYLVVLADLGVASAAIAGCCAMGIGGALGGSFSAITLLVLRRH